MHNHSSLVWFISDKWGVFSLPLFQIKRHCLEVIVVATRVRISVHPSLMLLLDCPTHMMSAPSPSLAILEPTHIHVFSMKKQKTTSAQRILLAPYTYYSWSFWPEHDHSDQNMIILTRTWSFWPEHDHSDQNMIIMTRTWSFWPEHDHSDQNMIIVTRTWSFWPEHDHSDQNMIILTGTWSFWPEHDHSFIVILLICKAKLDSLYMNYLRDLRIIRVINTVRYIQYTIFYFPSLLIDNMQFGNKYKHKEYLESRFYS